MEMKKIEETLPQRCEICHKHDFFDPNKNYCHRCENIIEDRKNQIPEIFNIPARFPTLIELRNEEPNFINRLISSIKDFPNELSAQVKNNINDISNFNINNFITKIINYNYIVKMLIPLYLLFTGLKFIMGFIAIIMGLLILFALQFAGSDPFIFLYLCLFEVILIVLFLVFNWCAKFIWKYWLDNS